jgi:replicative DNA helicase
VTFCKHQAITAAILEGPKLLQEEKFEEIESKIREAVSVGVGIMDMGEQYFIGWPERLRRRSQVTTLSTVPTGITELDSYLNGGLHAKQLGLWMGPTSRGKSLALMHCGKRAVIIKKRVAHYTLELSQDEVSTRYDATFSKIPVHDLLDKEYLLAARLDRLGLTWGNTLIVKEYPTKKAGVGTIRAHLLQLASIGFIPDLVIIDYLDLLRPPRYYKEKRDELSAITEEMKGLATEMSFPIWSATQANRSAISMETHTEEQMSEDIGKANISDILITLNQTKEEVDDEIMRLFLAKNRNGPRYRTIKIKTAFDRMSFYEPSGLS